MTMGPIAKALLVSQMAIGILVAAQPSHAQDSHNPGSISQPEQSPQALVQNSISMAPASSTNSRQKTALPSASTTPPSATLDDSVDAGEMDDAIEQPRRGMAHWNEYRGPHFTARAGLGLLIEAAGFIQDDVSKQQIKMLPDQRLRDFRFVTGGSFPSLPRKVTWNFGIMYDGPTHSWLVRQTGLMIAVPELWGNIFIGRSKEGFSLNKVMVGYDGWTMERSTMSDATIPILADGFKWLGFTPKHGFLWNVGYYNDWLSKNQNFSTYHNQTVGRFVWLPIRSDLQYSVLHLGVNLRNGSPEQGQVQFRSRPEAFPAPYFVDSGKFPATNTKMAGYETYFRKGPLLLGSEYWWVKVTSPSKHDPTIHGGDFVATWCITGETRVYNTVQGAFKEVIPKRPVFSGGPGAVELVARLSNIDLDSRLISGGKFNRFTPMVNWYLSDFLRLEAAYGVGRLDRFNLKGTTQFFQTRLQFEF
jgi:phosphate-selective porin OprO and OprP